MSYAWIAATSKKFPAWSMAVTIRSGFSFSLCLDAIPTGLVGRY